MNDNNESQTPKTPSSAVFADGIIFKRPREGAPDFVKGSLSFKVEEAVAFLQKHVDNGWVNVDLKKSKGGKLYLQLNDWKPKGDNLGDNPIKKQDIPDF